MSDQTARVQEILARLSAAPPPAPGQPPAGSIPYMSAPPPQYPPAVPYGAPNPYAYPQPTTSGSVDLSGVTPYQSSVISAPGNAPPPPGSGNFQDAIAKARSYASDHGATPYDRPPPGYGGDHRPSDPSRFPRSRSRSPPARREAYRDNYNPYRDERREDRGRDSGGYGRDRDRDRSFSPRDRHQRPPNTFSPRGRDRSPNRGGGDDNSETMQIDANLVGLIIGRQGENLRRVETDTGCRVQFLQPSGHDEPTRMCKISGPRPRRAEARAAINRIIDDSGMTPLGRGGGGGGGGGGPRHERGGRDSDRGAPVEPKEGEECIQIMVPDRTVGLIIGRGGETIRDLQERSGCHINIVGESKSVNGLRPVNLIGTHETAMNAKNLIMEIVDSDTRNGQQGGGPGGPPGGMGGMGGMGGPPRGHPRERDFGGPDKVNDSIYVPSEAVGMIIGKGGETIREMQSSTGCKINVSSSSGPNEVEREIGLVGSHEAIARAKQAIEDKVEAVRQKNSGGGGPPGRYGGGGGGGGRGGHRDYDNPNYGQVSSNNHSAPRSNASQQPPAVPGQPAAGAAPGGADPYAAYGGYQAYAAMWFQAMAQAQAQQPPGADGDKGNAPGA